MYSIGSVAALISGLQNTDNTVLELKEFKQKKHKKVSTEENVDVMEQNGCDKKAKKNKMQPNGVDSVEKSEVQADTQDNKKSKKNKVQADDSIKAKPNKKAKKNKVQVDDPIEAKPNKKSKKTKVQVDDPIEAKPNKKSKKNKVRTDESMEHADEESTQLETGVDIIADSEVKPKKAKKNKTQPTADETTHKKLKKNKVKDEVTLKRARSTDEPDEAAPAEKKSKKSDDESKRIIDPETLRRTIFVGNVPLNTKKVKLNRIFSKFGEIASLRLRGGIPADPKVSKKVAIITKQFHPKINSLQCYVVYNKEEDVRKALAANGTLLGEHHLRVDLAQKDECDQKRAIFIGNLPFDVADEDVWKTFDVCGGIESVRVIRDSLTGIGKGFGYVNFENSDGVELAMQMGDVQVKNRVVRIKRCSNTDRINKKRDKMGDKVRKHIRVSGDKNVDGVKKLHKKKERRKQLAEGVNPGQFQGVKFTDKKKKHKTSKAALKKKHLGKFLTAQKK